MVAEGVTAEEVAVSEAVVEVEGEGRVPAAVTAGLGRDPDQDQTRKATFLCITKISPTTHPSSLNSWHTKIWPRHIRIFYGILNQYLSFLICLPLLLVHFSS